MEQKPDFSKERITYIFFVYFLYVSFFMMILTNFKFLIFIDFFPKYFRNDEVFITVF